MKLDGKILVAVAMVLGSMAAVGCNKASTSNDEATAQQGAVDQAADQIAGQESTTVQAKASVGVSATSNTQPAVARRELPPPPPDRYENPGRAPSRDHVFIKGSWRFDDMRASYVWVPGRWEINVAPSVPPAPRYENPGRAPSDRHFWVSGYWRYEGGRYVWIAGHWDMKRQGHTYVGPHYKKINGRWHYVPGHWDRR